MATDAHYFDIDPSSVAPYIPTPQPAVERALELAAVTANDMIIDLGCGDGRAVITAAARFGAQGLGVEFESGLVERGRDLARQAGVAGLVQFVQADLFTIDLTPATVLFLFLRQGTLNRLRPRIEKELRKGARVLVYKYQMEGWECARVEQMDVRYVEPIRFYTR